jgi:hypothetical protein
LVGLRIWNIQQRTPSEKRQHSLRLAAMRGGLATVANLRRIVNPPLAYPSVTAGLKYAAAPRVSGAVYPRNRSPTRRIFRQAAPNPFHGRPSTLVAVNEGRMSAVTKLNPERIELLRGALLFGPSHGERI